MARVKKGVAIGLAHKYFPSFLESRQNAIALDRWINGEQYEVDDIDSRFHGRPYQPRQEVSDEYADLSTRTPTPIGGLIVSSVAQTSYVDGVRRPGKAENLAGWESWQANRWDSRQNAVHRAAVGHGMAYGVVIPGRNRLTGDRMRRWLARDPIRMAAFYDGDDSEWAQFAIEAEPYQNDLGIWEGWYVLVYDEQVVHRLNCKGDGVQIKDWTYVDFFEHGLSVPPIARCANRLDLNGRARGEIEPVLPLLRRIDQDTFDRLIVQRFGAWKIRYIAGMAKPSTEQAARLQALKLRVEDLLVSTDPTTKFGTLDSTDPEAFIKVTDADLRMLSAVAQLPPHHLLGLSSNLQAEALAAAEAGLMRKGNDFRMNAGEFHEQMFRMDAMLRGDREEAAAVDIQVRWRDTESRSQMQTAQALGMLASQLKIPVEMLWEKVPGWTDIDTDRAKQLIEDGSIEMLLAELLGPEQGATGDNAGAVQ